MMKITVTTIIEMASNFDFKILSIVFFLSFFDRGNYKSIVVDVFDR